MAAAINFYIPSTTTPLHVQSGSGLGFYGNGFGTSLTVGAYNIKTYLTNSAGTSNMGEKNNVKYVNDGSGVWGAGTATSGLLYMPNSMATLQIRFTNDTSVRVTSANLYIYDRTSINNNPSGVLCKCAEIIHPSVVDTVLGSGDSQWSTIAGSSSVLSLCPSPGNSGHFAGNGSNSQLSAISHDHYVAISASPSSVGSKLFAAAATYEFV